jgi:hypothetical protein
MTDTEKPRPPRISRGLAVALTLIAVALFLGGLTLATEAYLESRRFNGYSVWPPNMQQSLSPLPGIMPGIDGTSRFTTNNRGIRGRNISRSDDYRVLTIGGSTTECIFLDDTESWPRVLERELNERIPGRHVWVGNIGRSGRNTRHHLVQTRVMLEQIPGIDAIVYLVGVNDLSLRLSQDVRWRLLLPGSGRYARVEKEAFMIMPDTLGAPVVALPEIRRRLKVLEARLGGKSTDVPAALVQDPRGQVYAIWRRNRRESPKRKHGAPDLRKALREYRHNINKMIDIAGEHGVRVIFATQPSMWKKMMPAHEDTLLWMGGVGRFQEMRGRPFYTPAVLERCMALYNGALVDVCRERTIGYVDLAAVIPRDTTTMYDDCHFNVNGARRVADLLASFMASTPPLNGR